MKTIYIDYGLYTPITIDLSEFDFTDVDKVVLTAKTYIGNRLTTILLREYKTAEVHVETITPLESKLFKGDVSYDFIAYMKSGEVYKVSEVGKMVLRKGVGMVE